MPDDETHIKDPQSEFGFLWPHQPGSNNQNQIRERKTTTRRDTDKKFILDRKMDAVVDVVFPHATPHIGSERLGCDSSFFVFLSRYAQKQRAFRWSNHQSEGQTGYMHDRDKHWTKHPDGPSTKRVGKPMAKFQWKKKSKRRVSFIELIESARRNPSESGGKLRADDNPQTSDQAGSHESKCEKQLRNLMSPRPAQDHDDLAKSDQPATAEEQTFKDAVLRRICQISARTSITSMSFLYTSRFGVNLFQT